MRWALFVFLFSATAAAQPQPLVLELGGHRMDFALVPSGDFKEGSPATEKGRGADEDQYSVSISRPFFMAKTPVTRGQFSEFARETNYKTEAEKGTSGGSGWDGTKLVQKKEYNWKNPGFAQTDDDPVVIVTYDDALAFARWLEGKAGHHVSLPTEAQYEYATRAKTTTPYYAADPLDIGWFKENAGAGTRPVGKKTPNAFGLYDTSGNVYEWCRDWYAPHAADGVDPETTVAPSGDTARRVLRGGAWTKSADHGRSAARWRNTPGSRNADNGFRVVADIDPLPTANAPATVPTTTPTQAPIVTTPPPADESSWGVVAVAGVGALALLGAIVYLLRGRGPSGVRTTPRDDGFMIEGSVPQGSTVRWAAIVNGTDVSDAVRIEGAQTFVYTGGRPTNIRIVSVDYPEGPRGGGGYRGRTPYVAPPQPIITPPQPIIQDDPPFRGYPPAY